MITFRGDSDVTRGFGSPGQEHIREGPPTLGSMNLDNRSLFLDLFEGNLTPLEALLL